MTGVQTCALPIYFQTSYYDEYISLYMEAATKDIIVNQDKILEIDVSDVTVNVIPIQK